MRDFILAKYRLVAACLCTVLLLFNTHNSFGEGSKNLAPDGSGATTGTNTSVAYLLHHHADATFGITQDFLDPDAGEDERMYVRVKQGETLYFGLRRTDDNFAIGAYGDLNVVIRENDGTFVTSFLILADQTSDNGAGVTNFELQTSQAGVIESFAEALAGPSTVVGASGYNANSWTNTTLGDQDFYIEFLQSTAGSGAVTSTGDANFFRGQSTYDLWDFSVYDGTTEKPGRLFCKRWGFSTASFDNQFSEEMQLFVKIPSTVGGADAGNYIKEIDLAGLEPFIVSVYANTLGAPIASISDLNGDGVTDFQDARRSQTGNIGALEYDIFVNNPDIDEYPTTTLPTVSISDANFYCNSTSAGGEAAITISSNQSGFVAVFLDLDGEPGYQDGTADVIVEAEIDASSGTGSQVIVWDGQDGLGNTVASGTDIEITGRFTSGPLHLPLFDPEQNLVGINMVDIRPQTSFDLVYWDDRSTTTLDSDPLVSLTGTNTGQHTWSDPSGDGSDGGNGLLVNTWSFGFFQSNTENITFVYDCDDDGDAVNSNQDFDSDNDGLSDVQEGDYKQDSDGDGVFDYVDPDFAGFVDANNDGVNDNFDDDQDGIPNALDLDSDNDGIPDIIEAGLTDADNDGTYDDGAGFDDVNANGLRDDLDPDCVAIGGTTYVNTLSTGLTNTAFNPERVLGNTPTSFATLAAFDFVIVDFGEVLVAGTDITISFNDTEGAIDGSANVFQTTTGVDNFTNGLTYTATTGVGSGTGPEDFVYTLTVDVQFLAIQEATGTDVLVNVHTISYPATSATCGGTIGTALTIPDNDSDGVSDYIDLDSDNDGIVDAIEAGGSAGANGQISGFTDGNSNGRNDAQESVALTLPDTDADGSLPDYLDIDSDNDGILDNVEAQASNIIIASAAGDTDSNGLLDVYDPNNGGTLLTPVNTDGTDEADYRDTDADDDGVEDFIEGRDADFDGFSDVDSNEDRDISDETGHNVDTDGDGLWDLFESTTAPIQNTDNADLADYQDTDDDNDGDLTSGEDTNGNDNFTDDKTQGQGGSSPIPDYLFRGDYDGDAIADGADADSDNDGITDETESNGETIDPSGDADGDGIANYRDADDATVLAGLSATTDSNSDGVYDVYDTDLDGIPDFLDLDSDNDGIWDAIEADGGSVPNGLNTTTGQFDLDDPDNDGLMNFVDTDDVNPGGSSDLANPNSDDDALPDYRDIDSDDDGIEDIIESQASDGTLTLSGLDSDGDGIDDTFDPSNGGTLIDPVNSDGLDLRDYLDTDSDNDDVPDLIEGNDADNDGIADHGTVTGIDTDGDGLDDSFDADNGGTAPATQNSDGIDDRDWRDDNDDNDGLTTINEDANTNGDFSDDQTQGQPGSVPDYLYLGDFDGDGIADLDDADSDNDGIPDLDEDNGETIDPSGDEDGDGVPNFRDADDATVTAALTATTDSNLDGVYDVFDQDLDGIPDFRDRDSDNDGIPDIIETGGADTDANGKVDGLVDSDNDGIPDVVDVDATGGADTDADGIDDAFDASITLGTDTDGDDIIDTADPDIDGDGLANTVDADPNDNAVITSTLNVTRDTDSDGLEDHYDKDTDGDGVPDIVEAGGTDADGDGAVDSFVDTDNDGLADIVDSDNGGSALSIPDTDVDGVPDFRDKDSDNDGITDAEESGAEDSNSDGLTDGFASDTDGDGLADDVDPDNGGTALSNVDTDGDGISDFRDLDSDNDGYPDILEAGGTDAVSDGVVDATINSDPLEDSVPDNVDVDNFAANGGTGVDSDSDEIDDQFDVDVTGGTDTDGDGIDDTFDTDVDGDGYDDATESSPYGQVDADGDGNNDYRDLDADGDGIPDVTELGLTVNTSNAQIDGFTDANGNGWDDTQEAAVVSPPDFETDGVANFRDLDSDNDGIPDNLEAQTLATYVAPSGTDTDDDGLDDVYDPDNGGTLVSTPNTDSTDGADYLDTDADGDNVPDNVEGDNDDRSQFADWDTNSNNLVTDEAGFDTDTDQDGIRDIFDNNSGVGIGNITGSTSDSQDTDQDGIWDFQDTDDDGDGLLTSSTGGGNEDSGGDSDPTNDFDDDANNLIPNYLFGDNDPDDDGVISANDGDSDNDGLADSAEDGGTGIDPSGDIDGDGIANAQDFDMDGDGIRNENDADANGDGVTDPVTLTDVNGDGIPDQFDTDQDGIPNFVDLDSDNDGIADIIESGQTDTNEDGTVDEGSGFTADVNGNGMEDAIDPDCIAIGGTAYAAAIDESVFGVSATTPENALGNTPGAVAQVTSGQFMVVDLGQTLSSGSTVTISLNDADGAIDGEVRFLHSPTGANLSFVNQQNYIPTTGVGSGTGPEDFAYVLTADARYILVQEANTTAAAVNIHTLSFVSTVATCGGTVGVAVTPTSTDSDGIADYLDLDSDDDGISDNREAQESATYVAPAAGDTDGDGLLDVYDEDIAVGNAIAPTNTDLADNPDYQDTDSDNDNVPDVIEAYDSDINGFGDWDSNANNDETDEVTYSQDTDGDGILLLFDNNSTVSAIGNIDGTSAVLQDTDSDGTEDYRDTDDDGDGTDTDSEDANTNGDFSDDFVQGGGAVPDYLYNPDIDGDNVGDNLDFDPDNDGILSADEIAGGLPTPFGDEDFDNVFNYLDADLTGFTDTNSDGVDDRYDQDLDGVPNFFDLDSDNDGITDILESGGTDTDGDGMIDSFTDGDSDGFTDGITLTYGTEVENGGGNGVANPANADGAPNGTDADLNRDNEFITMDLGSSQPAGTTVAVLVRKPNSTDGSITFTLSQSTSSTGTFTNVQTFTPETNASFLSYYIELDAAAQFVRVEVTTRSGGRLEVEAIYFNANGPEDFDTDNLDDFLDLDSDNDGIVDNVEGRATTGYTAPSGTDSDGDGIDDSYDVDNGATALTLVNTDGDSEPDYRDLDSDNNPASPEDGVLDIVEGFDANRNGFSELDSDLDGDLTDESGYNVDTDGDGLWDLYDNFSGIGSVDNITGSRADLQDTDSDGTLDFRDTDDDEDGLTTFSEDVNTNGDYTDDKAQGGGATPDYLFFNDTDDDGIADGQDRDSDNDGIPDSDEYDNVAVTIDPFGDADGDGIFNYTDNSDAALSSLTDDNNDGIYDEYDFDLDGVPNFFDLDSDNDGIPDATEANDGTLPAGANSNGQFPESGPDTDDDGLVDAVDAAPSNAAVFTTTLPLTDTDGDGTLHDFLDLDSDNDGIVDLVEAGGDDFNGDGVIDGFGDTDGDGLANLVDSDNGGTALPVTSSDADGLPDYRDLDSEDDGTPDWDEGFDNDEDGDSSSDYATLRSTYETNNAGFPGVYTTTDSDVNTVPDYLDDDDMDGRPNFLSPGNAFYVDTDGDGVVDFFDPDQGGNSYGAPDNDADMTPNVQDGTDTPLPLDFLSFTGEYEDESVVLTWVTANEVDNDRMEVERSIDGVDFEVIGTVAPLNNVNQVNNYTFEDDAPQFGANYYRIRQVDFDGTSTTTNTIVVFAELTGFEFTLYPNPAKESFNIRTNFNTPMLDVEIISVSGRRMHSERYDQDASSEAINIDISHYPAGVYYIALRTGDVMYQARILKQ